MHRTPGKSQLDPGTDTVSRRRFLKQMGAATSLAPLAPKIGPRSQTRHQPSGSDWPRFGYDMQNTRFNAREEVLGRRNVGQLKPKWQFEAGATIQNCPAVVGDTLFFGTWAGEFFALNSQTGALKWKRSVGDPLSTEPRFLRSSPEYSQGRVYFATGATVVICLDAGTGREIWRTPMDEDPVANQSQITCSVTLLGDRLFVGTSSGRARIACLNARTGAVLWRFFTVPHVPNGGGSVWSSPAIDAERGIVYNGTGNAKSFMPPGPILFAESMLANDLHTGELIWYQQVRPGNVPFNLDFSCHPMLFDAVYPSRGHAARAGAVRKCVGAGNKAGFFTFDRYTGEPYWKTMLTNHSGTGGPTLSSTAVAYNRVFVVSNAISKGRPSTSVTAGLNAFTGDIEWWAHNSALNQAPVAVANGVFYQGLSNGKLEALDARDGQPLWEHQLPSAHRGGIAIANGALYTSNGARSAGQMGGEYSMYCFTLDGT